MFDGYDEITDGIMRRKCSKALISFMKKYSKCHYVVTSRLSIYEYEKFNNISTSETLYISPLSKEQIHEFLKKWLYPKGKSSIELYNRIIRTVQIENVVSNPLLLTMLTHVYSSSDFKFTNSRLDLYSNCTKCLLEQWDAEKTKRKRIVRHISVDTEVKVKLLAYFAHNLYIRNINAISKNELSQLFTKHPLEKSCFHGQAPKIIDEMLSQSGILEKMDNNNIRFRHRSFYEYFVCTILG